MKWIAALTLLLSFILFTAAADEALYPALSDPTDQWMQQLAVMSQRDEAFEGVKYNGGMLMQRGCLPVSVANSVIASFGLTDRETAVDVVKETAELLVFPRSRGTGRAEMKYLPSLISPQERNEQAILFPALGETVGEYPGEVRILDELDAQIVRENIKSMAVPGVLVGRMTVYPDWTEMIRLLFALDAMGYGDATVCLTYAGAGTENSGAPLRSGEGGHYVTMLIHASTFVREGRMYLLDSLPRSLKGESYGYTQVLRRPYPFFSEYTAFRQVFEASRISPTVIRFSLADRSAWQAADEEERGKTLAPMILFGPLVVMISLGQTM